MAQIWKEALGAVRGELAKANFQTAWKIVEKVRAAEIPDGSDPSQHDFADALRMRSMAGEVCDYVGDYGKAREFVDKAGSLCFNRLRRLTNAGRLGNLTPDAIEQQVWVLLQAGLQRYREVSFDIALDYFKLCDTVVAGPHSKTSKKQRLGTWARTKYSLGLVYREQYELQKAIAYFTESAELAYQSFLADRGSKLVPVAIARSLGMGLASIHATLGRPDLAVPLLMCAKAMLPESEILISTQIDLIRATLPDWVREPRMSRPQVSKLKELSRCHGVFSKRPQPHPVYRARAAYYLARECVQQAQLQQQDVGEPKAVELLKKSESLLGDLTLASSGDLRFELLGLALRSHIARINSLMFKDSKGVDRAVELATWGLQQTDDKRHPSVFVELVNARGLARMLQGNFRSAIDDFTSAMNLGARANNHRLCAVSLLRLSQAYLQVGSTQEAASCFSKFRELEPALHVRTADIALLADETERIMAEKGQDFVLTLASNFDPEMIQDEFRRFLVRWARSKTSSDKGAAEKLGIARQTLYQWVHK